MGYPYPMFCVCAFGGPKLLLPGASWLAVFFRLVHYSSTLQKRGELHASAVGIPATGAVDAIVAASPVALRDNWGLGLLHPKPRPQLPKIRLRV